MLFASEKQVFPIQTHYFSTKGSHSTQYYLVWTDVAPATLGWLKVAWLCSSLQLTWPHGLFNKLFSLSFFEDLSLSTVFKSFLVFIPLKMVPRLHIQSFSRTIKSFFSFTASSATIVRNPSWGSPGCLNFVTWSATPHFVTFFSFASDLWFLQRAFRL